MQVVTVQHGGFSEREVDALQDVLDKIGQRLGVSLPMRRDRGDILLLDSDFASCNASNLLFRGQDDRPVVLIEPFNVDMIKWFGAIELFGHRQLELQRQFMDLTLIRRSSPYWSASGWMPEVGAVGHGAVATAAAALNSGFDSDYDSRPGAEPLLINDIDEIRLELVSQALAGHRKPGHAPLQASYGPAANMVFDFRAGVVAVDPLAQQYLRVRRELPLPAPGAQPQANAIVRDLEETIWDLGMAAGHLALQGEPADWWHCRLVGVAAERIESFTRLPHHLELARWLCGGPATPSELRRRARVSVSDLRRFIQACLYLGLLGWEGSGPQ
ncbi:MAG: hypothetical protein KGM91_11270 [Burkholderiales bacterium]|nr:hypothetical protein [Burkholderiales bacterium]